MKSLYVIFFAMLLIAGFERNDCDACVIVTPFLLAPKRQILLFNYLSMLTYYIGLFAIVADNVLNETKYRFEKKAIMFLVAGWMIDFILRCNLTWFKIGSFNFAYTSFMFIIFGMVIIRAWTVTYTLDSE